MQQCSGLYLLVHQQEQSVRGASACFYSAKKKTKLDSVLFQLPQIRPKLTNIDNMYL